MDGQGGVGGGKEENETRGENQQHKRRGCRFERQTNVSGSHQRSSADDWTRTNVAERRRPRLMVLVPERIWERRGISDGTQRGRGRVCTRVCVCVAGGVSCSLVKLIKQTQAWWRTENVLSTAEPST